MVPEILGQMDSLEILDLSDNKLVLLPQSIRHLTNLRILNISSNRFSDMSLDSLAYLPHLTEIHASKNALTGSLFPSTVTLLPNLRILDVSKNSIASLTWASTNTSLSLPELMILNVSTNRLIALADLSTWTSLVTLTAEENAITILPAGFISLQRLRTANFEHNDLKVLDDDIAKMKSLEVFSVQGNPLREKRFLSMGAEVLKRELGRRAALGQEMGVDMEMKAGAAQEWVGDDEIF
jgi:Leucine-rich repeat (LRR) protein